MNSSAPAAREVYDFSTYDDPNYFFMMHVNSALSFCATAIAFYFIIYRSPKSFGNYKWYLLNIAVSHVKQNRPRVVELLSPDEEWHGYVCELTSPSNRRAISACHQRLTPRSPTRPRPQRALWRRVILLQGYV